MWNVAIDRIGRQQSNRGRESSRTQCHRIRRLIIEDAVAVNDTQAVLIFSFSRAGGRDAQNWAQRLSKDDPDLPLYTAIFLESVPRLFRSIAISGVRSGMPQAMLDRTLLLYQQQGFWEQRLHVTDERYASVIVLGPGGHIRWITSEPFADSLYLELRKQIQAFN